MLHSADGTSRDRVPDLLDAVVAVGSDLDLASVLRRIVDAAVRLVDAEYGALGVIGGNGYLAQFITSGIDESGVARIGTLPRGHGILGLLIREPQPLRLDDLGTHPSAFGFPPGHPPMRSFLGVPVRVRDAVFGNLYLTEKRGGASFDAEDETVVLALATAAGVAIEHARLFEQSLRRERWVAASAEVSTALLSGRDPEDVLPLVARLAAELTGAETALVALPPQPGRDGLVVEVAVGPHSPDLMGRDLGEPGSTVARARESGSAVALSDDDGPHQLVSGRWIGSGVVVPLGEAGARGVLVVKSSVGAEPVRLEGLSELQTFAVQAALALELAERRRDAERLSIFEDRDRIARDLHDVVIQRLFATGMQLESANRLLSPQAATRVRRAVDDLDATIKEIRSSIYALQTEADDTRHRSLRSRVLAVVDAGADQLGFRPSLQLTGLVDTGVPAEAADHLLAVLREALSNVARHAQARSVLVRLDVDDAVRLLVRDDGTGLADDGRRSGLSNLASRAEELGGSFRVGALPPPQHGTELVWEVPARDGRSS